MGWFHRNKREDFEPDKLLSPGMQSQEAIKNLKKENRRFKIGFFLMFILILFISSFFIYSQFYPTGMKSVSNISVDWGNTSLKDQQEIQELLDNVKEDYLVPIKSITILDTIKELQKISHDNKEERIIGLNIGNKIYIVNQKDQYLNAILLCHEIEHSLLSLEYDLEERIVEDREPYFLCYKDRKLIKRTAKSYFFLF